MNPPKGKAKDLASNEPLSEEDIDQIMEEVEEYEGSYEAFENSDSLGSLGELLQPKLGKARRKRAG